VTLEERFLGLPRAMRWAIFALVAFVLYFAAVEPALNLYTRLDDDVQGAKLRLAELEEQVKDREADLSNFERGLARHGEVLPPRPLREVEPDVYALWQEVQQEFESVTGVRLQSGELGMSSDAIRNALVPPGAQLSRVRFTANFDASPEQIIAIVRRLEASPLIHSVSAVRLRLNSADQRVLTAQIETESWAHTGQESLR